MSALAPSKLKPKFRVGDTVTYCSDRRFRHRVVGRYWDPDYPGWRYRVQAKPRFFSSGRNGWISVAWAPVEEALLVATALERSELKTGPLAAQAEEQRRSGKANG